MEERDLELLSAYIDDALDDAEKRTLELRLKAEPALRRELESLRETVNLIGSLPVLKAPRDFTLSSVPARSTLTFYTPWLSLASAAAAAVLIILGFLNLNVPLASNEGLDTQSVANMPTNVPATGMESQLPANVPTTDPAALTIMASPFPTMMPPAVLEAVPTDVAGVNAQPEVLADNFTAPVQETSTSAAGLLPEGTPMPFGALAFEAAATPSEDLLSGSRMMDAMAAPEASALDAQATGSAADSLMAGSSVMMATPAPSESLVAGAAAAAVISETATRMDFLEPTQAVVMMATEAASESLATDTAVTSFQTDSQSIPLRNPIGVSLIVLGMLLAFFAAVMALLRFRR